MTSATDELRKEAAPPSAWRERALELHKDGQQEDCVKVLEESMDAFKEPERLGEGAEMAMDKRNTMHMLISAYLMQFLRNTQEPSNAATEESLRVPLTRASNLLEQVADIDGEAAESMQTLDLFVNRGFHALTQYKLRSSSGASHELTRANMFFNSALKIDSAAPRAVLGKASAFIHLKEWAKALTLLRQIIERGPKAEMKKEVKFAMAICFCGMERYEQMRRALMGVLEVDPDDVETLCALAQLDAYLKNAQTDDDSAAYLEKAWKVDHENPVVLMSAANSAFLVGMEMDPEDRVKPDAPWATAKDLLQDIVDGKASWEIKAEAHYQIGRLKHAQDLFQEAYEEYQKCRDIAPEHETCLYCFAQTCMELGLYQDGISALETILKNHPNKAPVLKLLAFAYLQTNHREAVTTAEALCAPGRSDNDVEAWSMLAEAHEQRNAAGDEAALKSANDAYAHVAKLLEAGTGKDQASPQMWNNLGTLRGLEGNAEAASQAYAQAFALVEEQKTRSTDNNAEEAKDLHVTELTVRFNRAWLAESGDQPDNLQATSDLLKLREEVSWYADTTLRLGTQWLNIGDFDRAAETYGEASKQSPVLAAVMQAHVYKQKGDYPKAVQAAEKAVERATSKTFHYVHVHSGNLYFELSQDPQHKHEREKFLSKALWHFMEAFKNAKDSHYAAIGIGMVFAQRGRLEFAKRTFQSVLQHVKVGSTADDPSIYINLGHTYVKYGGEEARKAISLYEKARKLRPSDVSIRLYLARAHFELKEYERCVGILSDALTFAPEDIVLRYNLAMSLESWGKVFLNDEIKEERVVGMETGKDKMERAVGVLTSAASHFGHIKERWAQMPQDVQKQTAKSSANASKFTEDMRYMKIRQEYCEDRAADAKMQLDKLVKKREEMDKKMADVASQKKAHENEKNAEKSRTEEDVAEHRRVLEDKAIDLMRETDEIVLGRNIGMQTDKPPPKPRAEKSLTDHVQRKEKAPKAPKPVKEGAAKKLTKKQLKKMKKQAKKEKKRKKREGGGSTSEPEDGMDPDVPTHTQTIPTEEIPSEQKTNSIPSVGEPTVEPNVEPLLPVEQAKELDVESAMEEDAAEDDEEREKRKAAKRDKKAAKKDKKKAKKDAKKKRKQAGSDEDDFDAAGVEQELDAAPPDDAKKAKQMEDELFGSDDDN